MTPNVRVPVPVPVRDLPISIVHGHVEGVETWRGSGDLHVLDVAGEVSGQVPVLMVVDLALAARARQRV